MMCTLIHVKFPENGIFLVHCCNMLILMLLMALVCPIDCATVSSTFKSVPSSAIKPEASQNADSTSNTTTLDDKSSKSTDTNPASTKFVPTTEPSSSTVTPDTSTSATGSTDIAATSLPDTTTTTQQSPDASNTTTHATTQSTDARPSTRELTSTSLISDQPNSDSAGTNDGTTSITIGTAAVFTSDFTTVPTNATGTTIVTNQDTSTPTQDSKHSSSTNDGTMLTTLGTTTVITASDITTVPTNATGTTIVTNQDTSTPTQDSKHSSSTNDGTMSTRRGTAAVYTVSDITTVSTNATGATIVTNQDTSTPTQDSKHSSPTNDGTMLTTLGTATVYTVSDFTTVPTNATGTTIVTNQDTSTPTQDSKHSSPTNDGTMLTTLGTATVYTVSDFTTVPTNATGTTIVTNQDTSTPTQDSKHSSSTTDGTMITTLGTATVYKSGTTNPLEPSDTSTITTQLPDTSTSRTEIPKTSVTSNQYSSTATVSAMPTPTQKTTLYTSPHVNNFTSSYSGYSKPKEYTSKGPNVYSSDSKTSSAALLTTKPINSYLSNSSPEASTSRTNSAMPNTDEHSEYPVTTTATKSTLSSTFLTGYASPVTPAKTTILYTTPETHLSSLETPAIYDNKKTSPPNIITGNYEAVTSTEIDKTAETESNRKTFGYTQPSLPITSEADTEFDNKQQEMMECNFSNLPDGTILRVFEVRKRYCKPLSISSSSNSRVVENADNSQSNSYSASTVATQSNTQKIVNEHYRENFTNAVSPGNVNFEGRRPSNMRGVSCPDPYQPQSLTYAMGNYLHSILNHFQKTDKRFLIVLGQSHDFVSLVPDLFEYVVIFHIRHHAMQPPFPHPKILLCRLPNHLLKFSDHHATRHQPTQILMDFGAFDTSTLQRLKQPINRVMQLHRNIPAVNNHDPKNFQNSALYTNKPVNRSYSFHTNQQQTYNQQLPQVRPPITISNRPPALVMQSIPQPQYQQNSNHRQFSYYPPYVPTNSYLANRNRKPYNVPVQRVSRMNPVRHINGHRLYKLGKKIRET